MSCLKKKKRKKSVISPEDGIQCDKKSVMRFLPEIKFDL